MQAGQPLPKWRALWPWFSWPALAVVLFCTHQFVVNSKQAKRC
jgi:hypothetical protein